jgi:hypothetical protein
VETCRRGGGSVDETDRQSGDSVAGVPGSAGERVGGGGMRAQWVSSGGQAAAAGVEVIFMTLLPAPLLEQPTVVLSLVRA